MDRLPLPGRAARKAAESQAQSHHAWICTHRLAIYCPVHGDCSCANVITRVDRHCPLHGTGTTHGEMVA